MEQKEITQFLDREDKIIAQIKNLQKPTDDTTKEYLKLAKALEDFFYQRVPKTKNWIKRIINYLKGVRK